MRRAGLALLLTASAIALVLGVTAGPASALYSPTTAPYVQAGQATNLVTAVNSTDAPSTLTNGGASPPRLPGYGAAAEDAAWFDAEVAAGAAPAVGTLGTLALGVSAFAIGWQIGSTINHYFHISGSIGTSATSGGSLPLQWAHHTTLTNPPGCADLVSPSPGCTSGAGWTLEDQALNGRFWNVSGSYYPDSVTGPAAFSAAGSATQHTGGGPRAAFDMTDAQMRGNLTITPESSTAYTAEPVKKTTAGFSQTTTATTAKAALGNPVASLSGGVYHDAGGATLTPAQVQQQTDINCKLDASFCAGGANDVTGPGAPLASTFSMPDCVGLSTTACDSALAALGFTGTTTYTDLGLAGAVVTKPAGAVVTQASAFGSTVPTTGTLTFTRNPTTMPVLLPQPLLNETYDQYLTRLTTLGWLGVAVPLDLTDTSAETQLGPSAPVRITVTTTVGTQTLSPLAWPAAPPRIAPTAGLSITRNPATTAPATAAPPPPGTTGGGGSCSCPPLDLTPITGASVGSKFPFGVFTWITHAIGLFDVSPTTPEVHFPVHLGSTSVHSFADDDFYVNLGFFDGYMSTMRLLLTFFMWAAAIWFVAAKFLKVDWAGEPGDGTDELL
jgi:hypothetical protein